MSSPERAAKWIIKKAALAVVVACIAIAIWTAIFGG